MKKIKTILFFLLISVSLLAQNNPDKRVATKISEVKVYLNNAEISRSQKILLQAGNTKVVFTGLSPQLVENSVRFKISPEISILQITVVTNYLENEAQKPKIKLVQDSINQINEKIKDLQNEIAATKSALDVLSANKSIGGQNVGVSVANLKLTVDYYNSESLLLNKKITNLDREISKLTTQNSLLVWRLQNLNAQPGLTRKEVELLVSSDQAVTCDFSIIYLVDNAGWSPIYDIKAEDTDKPVNLVYRAQVYNNTDIDWESIPLILSINNPNLSNTKPEISTWFLKEQVNQRGYSKSLGIQNKSAGNIPQSNNKVAYAQENVGSDDFGEINSNVNIPDYTENQTYVPILSYDFNIEGKYNIPSDNKPYLVNIAEEQLKADFKHYTVPKLDKRVFLIAQVTGWQELNLIDGQANLYYAGSYIGRSFLSIGGMNDTLDLSLGADSKVVINREKLNQLSSTKFMGNKKTVTFAYEITLKNNHKSDVIVELLDQIPISQSDEIEIKDIELSGGELNKTTGVVKWTVNMKAGETKKISFIFSIRFSKNLNVPLQQMQNTNIRYYN